MASTTLQTFGVDGDVIRAALAQLPTGGATDVITTARLTELIEQAAAEVCGVLLAAGIAPADVNAEPASIGYIQCRRLVSALTVPSVMRSSQGFGFAVSQDVKDAEGSARELMKRIEANPTLLGFDAAADTSPGVWTTTSNYSALPSTNASVRREWQQPTSGRPGPEW